MVLSVIVHFNNAEDCIRCVTSLLSVDLNEHKVLVVDNCSEPKKYQEVLGALQNKPNVDIIKTKKNGGFGYGVNRGIEYFSSLHNELKYIHVINCDSEIINKSYLKSLSEILDAENEIGIIAPAVFCEDGVTIQNTILPITSLSSAINFKKNFSNLSRITNPPSLIDVDCLNGVCFLIRKQTFELINGFCEDYFMYNEEQDLCLKVKQNNKRVVFWSGVGIRHFGAAGNTSGYNEPINWRFSYTRRNQILFIKKRGHFFEALTLALIFSLTSIPKFLSPKNKIEITWSYFIKQLIWALRMN